MLKPIAEINNSPEFTPERIAKYGAYVVARYDDRTHSLWYYGAWLKEADAENIADQIGNGLVLHLAEVSDGV